LTSIVLYIMHDWLNATCFGREWDKERANSNKPKLWKAVWRMTWKIYLVVVIVVCFDELVLRQVIDFRIFRIDCALMYLRIHDMIYVLSFRTIQPLTLRNFIRTFRENTGDLEIRKQQFTYASALVLCTIFHAIIYTKLSEISSRIGIKMRVGVSSVIYRKVNL